MVQEDQLDGSQSIGNGVASTLRVCLVLARLSLTAFDPREGGLSPLKVITEKRVKYQKVIKSTFHCLSIHSINTYLLIYLCKAGFPGGSDGKESACNVGDLGSICGLGRSPGGGHGKPFQYSCLENSMDRGAWRATYSPWGCKESYTTERLSTEH